MIFTRNDTNPASNRKAWTRPCQLRPMRDSVIMKFLILGSKAVSMSLTLMIEGASYRAEPPGAESQSSSGRTLGPHVYAAICLEIGAVLTSIRRGSAEAATGAVISRTPSLYSALSLSASTPSGIVNVRSNAP